MPKPVKIIIATVSIVTVTFFSIVGFLIFGFIGYVTISGIIDGDSEYFATPIIGSLPEYSDDVYYSFGFRDGYEYAEYRYDNGISPSDFSGNAYFKKVTESDTESIKEFTCEYEESIKVCYDNHWLGSDIKKHYTFSQSAIDTNDYFYIFTNDCGTDALFYYDTESKTLFMLRTIY